MKTAKAALIVSAMCMSSLSNAGLITSHDDMIATARTTTFGNPTERLNITVSHASGRSDAIREFKVKNVLGAGTTFSKPDGWTVSYNATTQVVTWTASPGNQIPSGVSTTGFDIVGTQDFPNGHPTEFVVNGTTEEGSITRVESSAEPEEGGDGGDTIPDWIWRGLGGLLRGFLSANYPVLQPPGTPELAMVRFDVLIPDDLQLVAIEAPSGWAGQIVGSQVLFEAITFDDALRPGDLLNGFGLVVDPGGNAFAGLAEWHQYFTEDDGTLRAVTGDLLALSVPEPATVALLGISAVGIFLCRRPVGRRV